MPVTKQNLAIPFAAGIDTKTDPLQVMPANFIEINDAVFTSDKRLTKRNGFMELGAIPSGVNATTLTTFKSNVVAIGSSLQAYSTSTDSWYNHGTFQPCQLSTVPLVRSSSGQSRCDSAVASNGFVCTSWEDTDGTSKYLVADSTTGGTIVAATSLPSTAVSPKAFVLGNYFIVTFLVTIAATPTLQYVAIPVATPTSPHAAVTISSQVKGLTYGYDGLVVNRQLYTAWAGSDGGGAIRFGRMDANLNQSGVVAVVTLDANLLSMTEVNSNLLISYYNSSATTSKYLIRDLSLNAVLAPTTISTSNVVVQLSGVYFQISNVYSFASIRSDYIIKYGLGATGTVTGPTTVLREVGLASKAFVLNSNTYMLAVQQSTYQPTYFLIDDTGHIVARLAYSNAGGYTTGPSLASVSIAGNVASISYLYKDLLTSVSKDQGSSQASIYSQTGVNLVSFDLSPSKQLSVAELGNNLHIAGGYLWMYDGALLAEHGFHLWPENLLATPSTTGGHLTDQVYYYQAVYEWTDAQGNIHRSAPSLPLIATVSGGGGNGSVVLKVPTLRLTAKPNVRIVIYRWSTAQQNYYQITSISSPTLNSTSSDSISYTDTLADSSILGNQLIYTTGGVIENIPMPACSALGLFKSRLFVIDSEDADLLWYSKQVIQSVPVEPSDLFTIYIAPTIGAQGSTGSTRALAALDDKLIASKSDAFYYITGDGPNNLGQNNDFSEPVFINSTVGCGNPQSIAFIPQGLILQSDKGVWLLGRDLNTSYIGAPVEAYNDFTVTSALAIPGTNQVRLCLNSGKALMYDYYYGRWATFRNIPAISSTLFQGLHTYLTELGSVRQETIGVYVDVGVPVLMSFTTAWMNLAGLQGFQRGYMVYLLGQYISPHKLSVSINYDYLASPSQSVSLTPANFAGYWGATPGYWGEPGVWGGTTSLEQWRIFLTQQKMQAFQVTVTESFDPSFGTTPGAGLTFSGLNMVVGVKKGYVPLPASQSAG